MNSRNIFFRHFSKPDLHPTSDHIHAKYHQHPIDVAFLNYKDRKRILITGGAGFVGSHLTDRLMLAGHEVIVADNMFTGNTVWKFQDFSVIQILR